jgi:hypothetical protein
MTYNLLQCRILLQDKDSLPVDNLLPLAGQGPTHLDQEIKVSDSIPLSLNMVPFVGFTLTSPMVLAVLQLWH